MPFATVLVPTHDRAGTLPVAVATAQAQSMDDIEILIACDGATEPTIAVARAIAADDERVTVFEFEKGPNRGGATRDRALEHAQSDRVLVLQDDDVWFPNHVEHLTPLLDDHDVVTSATLAQRPSGARCVWVSNYANVRFREAACAHGYKMVFEANYAFRLDSYRRRGVRWQDLPASGNIRRLLDVHLADRSARWASTGAVTAISFNAPTRTTPDEEAAHAATIASSASEIAQGMTGDEAASTAGSASALWSSLDQMDVSTGSLDDHLDDLAVSIDGVDHLSCDDEQESRLGFPYRRRLLEDAFEVLSGRSLDDDTRYYTALLDLVEPWAGPHPRCWQAARLTVDALGGPRAQELAAGLVDSSPAATLNHALGFAVAVHSQTGRPNDAAAFARRALDASGSFVAFYRALAERLGAVEPLD